MPLTCCISGQALNDTREERVVQRMAHWLLSLGYRKEQIQIHPQYCVRRNASRKKRDVPVDVAVFLDRRRSDESLLLIGECKPPEEIVGLDQLRGYLRASNTKMGLWFDGNHFTFVMDAPDVFGEDIGEPLRSQTSHREYANQFGSYVRLLRQELQEDQGNTFSLRQVAKRANIAPAYLSRLERGDLAPPSDVVISDLARELNVEADVLMAKAGKLPSKIQEIILLRPAMMTAVIDALEDAPDEVLKKIIARAKEIRDGDW